MAEILEIVQLGNPVLRRQSLAIDDVRDEAVQKSIDNLIATALEKNGVGIAAPQVGKSDRLFILASRPNLRYPHAPKMEPTAIINPKIVDRSNEIIKDWEGCLSIPGIRGLVGRSRWIEVEYTTASGKLQGQEFNDFVARIFQHEYDHLQGIVFLDRVESTIDLMSEDEYQKRVVLKTANNSITK